MTPWLIVGLFLCGAVLSLVSVAAGAYLAANLMHAGRTGAKPSLGLPKVSVFRRRPPDDDDDDPEVSQVRQHRSGP